MYIYIYCNINIGISSSRFGSSISERAYVNPTLFHSNSSFHTIFSQPDFSHEEKLKMGFLESAEIDCKRGYMKIEIIDTGIGISADDIQRLFQPFVQAQDSSRYIYILYPII